MEAHSIPASKTEHKSRLLEFYMVQLRHMYWTERKMMRLLPRMIVAATAVPLQQAFEAHLSQKKAHVARLEHVFELLGAHAEAEKCHSMAGIADEAQDAIDDTDSDTALRDAALVFAMQKAEHYEIASYGGLLALSRALGYGQAAEALGQTLAEEKEMDSQLTEIALSGINYRAGKEMS